MPRQRWQQVRIPAFILGCHELVHGLRDMVQLFCGGQAVGADVLRAMFDILQETRNANFHEFVQIVGGDGQEFYAFEQRIAAVARFFQHALVERHPLQVAVEVKAVIVKVYTCHKPSWVSDHKYLRCVTRR